MASTLGLAPGFREKIDQLLALSGGRVTVVSGLRSREEQIALRRAHCGTSHYDIYEKPASQCDPATARPGESKHERGLAVDLGGDLALASRVGRQLGLSTPVPGEEWHFEDRSAVTAGLKGPQFIQNAAGGILDLGGDLVEAAVEPLLQGLQRVLITGALLAGGVALVVAGGYRGVTGGRRITSDAGTAVTIAATRGAAAKTRSPA